MENYFIVELASSIIIGWFIGTTTAMIFHGIKELIKKLKEDKTNE